MGTPYEKRSTRKKVWVRPEHRWILAELRDIGVADDKKLETAQAKLAEVRRAEEQEAASRPRRRRRGKRQQSPAVMSMEDALAALHNPPPRPPTNWPQDPPPRA